jgi:hypothetical protein
MERCCLFLLLSLLLLPAGCAGRSLTAYESERVAICQREATARLYDQIDAGFASPSDILRECRRVELE